MGEKELVGYVWTEEEWLSLEASVQAELEECASRPHRAGVPDTSRREDSAAQRKISPQ